MFFTSAVVCSVLGTTLATSFMAKTSTKGGKGSPNRGSPLRRKKEGTPTKGSKIKKTQPRLTVRAFDPVFNIEAYIYEKTADEDGFLHSIQQYSDNDLEIPALDELGGITKLVPRRLPGTDEQQMLGGKGFWRRIIIRYVDAETGSTPESRRQGLEALSAFFRDSEFSRFPPDSIETTDVTGEDPEPLDNYFLNYDIKVMMEEDIDNEALNTAFFGNNEETALKCWSRPTSFQWATGLGFPVLGA